MNHLATDILYRRVIIDDLGLLLASSTNPPAHPQIASKSSLLLRVQKLHLEYRAKHQAPTYFDIMKDGHCLWTLDLHVTRPVIAASLHALREAKELSFSLEKVRKSLGRSASSRLSHVTVGAIFGGQDGLWEVLAPPADSVTKTADWTDNNHLIAHCRIATEVAFCSLPISHFCLRGTAGPLALPPGFGWYQHSINKPSPTSPLFTVHFSMETSPLPVAYGHRMRWMYEHHGYRNVAERIFEKVNYAIYIAGTRRSSVLADYKRTGDIVPNKMSFDLAIWASGDRMGQSASAGTPNDKYEVLNNMHLSAEHERQFTKHLAEGVRLAFSSAVAKPLAAMKDKYEINSSVDSPKCTACSWEYEGGPLEGIVVGGGDKVAVKTE